MPSKSIVLTVRSSSGAGGSSGVTVDGAPVSGVAASVGARNAVSASVSSMSGCT